jgi:hypothetical protein
MMFGNEAVHAATAANWLWHVRPSTLNGQSAQRQSDWPSPRMMGMSPGNFSEKLPMQGKILSFPHFYLGNTGESEGNAGETGGGEPIV